MNENRSQSRLISVIWSLTLALFAVSASIAAPILWRGFYALHIDALQLSAHTGFSRDKILGAYNEMMDFCVKGAPFGTGALKWSEDGMRHFEDVRMLFLLDLRVLYVTTVLLIVLFAVLRKIAPYRFLGRGPSFFAGAGLLVSSVILTFLAALDFDRAFVVFHRIFFPGKTNWIFDYRTDEIILILPQVFFRNCAIFAVSLLTLFCAGYLIAGRRRN
ncbi:MAG: TIGR01906 family membrane protein [Lachnospiraceae bacterium]|nr:TIGR01906 family membrane protein [Lachnospiraceae bacterium]